MAAIIPATREKGRARLRKSLVNHDDESRISSGSGVRRGRKKKRWRGVKTVADDVTATTENHRGGRIAGLVAPQPPDRSCHLSSLLYANTVSNDDGVGAGAEGRSAVAAESRGGACNCS